MALSAEEEAGLMRFFALKKKTKPSMEKRSAEIKEWRARLCSQMRGETVLDCLLDLQAHGVESVDEAKKYKKANGRWQAIEPLHQFASRYPFHGPDEDDTSVRQTSSNSVSVIENVWFIVAGLVALAASVVATYLILSQQIVPACTAEARESLPEIMNFLRGRHSTRHEKASIVLAGFVDNLVYDWSDKDNVDDPPDHAITLRLQGTNATNIESFVDQVVGRTFGRACSKQHVRKIDLSAVEKHQMDAKDVHHEIKSFLEETKSKHRDAISLFVFSNAYGPLVSKVIMSLKDYLWMSDIKIGTFPTEKHVSSHGVGFVFLGGSMKASECPLCALESHDSAAGWEDNVLGRISFKACLCGNEL